MSVDVKENNPKRPFKFYCKALPIKLCNCRGSEPEKVSCDVRDHEIRCHIRKRILSGHYTTNTSVLPKRIDDGYCLGVIIGGVGF